MSQLAKQINLSRLPKTPAATVYSATRKIAAPRFTPTRGLTLNKRLKKDGLALLSKLPVEAIPVAFFDPQYRGILDKMSYGNEGVSRGKKRSALKQMRGEDIRAFIAGIDRALIPSGYLFLWMDKFHLCTGFQEWLGGTRLEIVDMVTWDKERIGMGYRTRRRGEHVVVLQKRPRKAKGVWKIHDIPDVWREKVLTNGHAHKKPVGLQSRLIEAVSNENDVVVDPAAGSFSVLEACQNSGRNFLGCDIEG